MKNLIFIICLMFLQTVVLAESNELLLEPGLGPDFEPSFKILVDEPVKEMGQRGECRSDSFAVCSVGSRRSRSPVERLVNKQSGVRNQGQRGTCSIFATLAYVEWALIQMGLADQSIDLSEEWLQYLAVRDKQVDGSWTERNLELLRTYGPIVENSWPYDAQIWNKENPKTTRRCAYVLDEDSLLESCMLVHRDPRLLEASLEELLDSGGDLFDPQFASFLTEGRRTLFDFRELLSKPVKKINKVSTVKMLLNRGMPIIMSTPFFYGAWNHGKKRKLGIGDVDYRAWTNGEVGYPEPDSMDIVNSRLQENKTSHVIVLVGYDDNKVIRTTYLKQDGSIGQKEYKGVYYFKNSWGQSGFGSDFRLGNNVKQGYGIITQKYAHEFGEFSHMDINPRLTMGLNNH